MFQNKNLTPLSQLGEFGLIEHIQKNTQLYHQQTIKGIGDDAAVIEKDEHHYTLISTDMLIENIHYDLVYTPLKHLGYKAVVVNLSDIYAMNGTPRQILVSIAISNKFTLEAVEEIYTGIHLACERYGVDLVGGDTSTIPQGSVISITAIGEVEKDKIVYRNGAQEKDLIVVTGDLGGAYMGLQILQREKAVFLENPKIQPDLEGNDYILERQLKPEARKDIIEEFKRLKIKPTSMIDISDGLASEILHICKQSNKGCEIYEEKIPIDYQTYDRAREFNLDPTTCAMNGGEDYELLFTIPLSEYDKIKNHPDFTPIGYITEPERKCQLISKSGTSHPIQAQGWKHF
ncbi:MAG: thiamine-phosphate kinase [Bacteroidetes bacterium]|nr:MAG: thiamine-phosphate kinase [Bacteroidota bacterium]